MASKRGIAVLSIVTIMLTLAFINIDFKNTKSPESLDCKEFGQNGNCIAYEGITILTEQTNSIIDAETVFIDEENNIDIGSEKMILKVKSVLLDSNQKIVSNSSQNIDFIPATLLDLEQNILDLGSVQLTFDMMYKKNANVIVNGEVEVLLCDVVECQSKGKRYISFSGQLPENQIRLNVDKESKLLSDRTKSFTFTLADEGKDWSDGSIHNLKIVLKNLKSQVIINGQIQNFEYGSNLILYNLELTVDGRKIVTFDESHNAIAIFKADNTFRSCSMRNEYIISDNGERKVFNGIVPTVLIYVNDELVEESRQVNIENGVCTEYGNLPRNSMIKTIIDGKKFEFLTPSVQKQYFLNCFYSQNEQVISNHCNSNVGYSS